MAEPHVLVVENPEGDMARPWSYRVECPGVTDDCRAWAECRADAWPCNADRERVDVYDELCQTDWTAHGVDHQWAENRPWTPTGDSLVVVHPQAWDAADELELPGPGRYAVELEPPDVNEPEEIRLRLVDEVTTGA